MKLRDNIFIFTSMIGGVLLSYIFSILTINLFSIEDYGKYNLFMSLASLFGILINFGMSTYISKEFVTSQNKNIIKSSLILNTIIFMVLLPIIYIKQKYFIDLLNIDRITFNYIIFYFLVIALKNNLKSFMICKNKAINYNLFENLFQRGLIILALLLIYKNNNNFLSILKIKILIDSLYCIFIFSKYFFKEKANKYPKISLDKKYLFFIMLEGLSHILVYSIDKLMLGKYLSMTEVGVYSFVLNLVLILNFLKVTLNNTTINSFSKSIKNKNKNSMEKIFKESQLILTTLATPLVCLYIGYSSEILTIFKEELIDYKILLIILALSNYFDLLSGYNGIVMSFSSYYKYLFYSKIFFLFFMVLSNYILIPKYGVNGAAVATVLSYFVLNVFKNILIYSKDKITPLNIENIFQIGLIVISFYSIKIENKGLVFTIIYFIVFLLFNYLILFIFLRKKYKKQIKSLMGLSKKVCK